MPKPLTYALIFTLLLEGCGLNLMPKSYSYRYRLTVEIDTPKGVATGSNVIENTESEGMGIPDSSLHLQRRGEAIVVDLPHGRMLIATLKTMGGFNGVFAKAAYNPVLPSRFDDDSWEKRNEALKKQRAPAILPRDAYPMLITFRDPRDPTTVERVDPENLERTFGAGTRIRRIVVQMTRDRVTTGLIKRLPWLDHLSVLVRRPDQHLWPDNPERNLGKGAFIAR